jgi:transposase
MGKSKDTKSKRSGRRYDDEFKKDAVNLVVVQGYSFQAASDAVGVSSRSLRDWHEKLAPSPDTCGTDATLIDLQEENKRLRKQLRQAELERAILKKATAYFAKESQ